MFTNYLILIEITQINDFVNYFILFEQHLDGLFYYKIDR